MTVPNLQNGRTLTAEMLKAILDAAGNGNGNGVDTQARTLAQEAKDAAQDALQAANDAVSTANNAVEIANAASALIGEGTGSLSASINAHTARNDNPHGTTAAQVGAYTKAETDTALAGKASTTALAAETTNRTNADATTLANAKAYADIADTALAASVTGHTTRNDNPHGTTAAQVGAYTTAQVDALLVPVERTANKGQANGYAPLDASKFIPVEFIPPSVVSGGTQYKGAWNATTNSPALSSGVGVNGAFYTVSVAGSTSLDGINTWSVGDQIIFNGTTAKWERVPSGAGQVASVAGKTGVVTLASTDLTDSTGAGRAVLTAANPAAQRTALQLGDAATKNTGTVINTVAAGDDSRIIAAATHVNATNNPHNTTAAQVGAYTTAQVDTLLAAKATTTALAPVATAGTYASLTGKPTLGDAAAKNTGTTAGTVAAGDDSRLVNIGSHITATTNPHGTTAAQVGAYTTAQVDAAIATEATTRSNADTANATAIANEAQARSTADATNAAAILAHTQRTDNPHGLTAAQIGAYTAGQTDAADLLAMAAANAYADAGDTLVLSGISNTVTTAVAAHASRTDNPHGLTPAQIGVYSASQADAADLLAMAAANAYADAGDAMVLNSAIAAFAAAFSSNMLAWFNGLPTTLPSATGVLWNNGGTLAKS